MNRSAGELGPDGPRSHGWSQLGQNAQGQNLTPVDALAGLIKTVNGLVTTTTVPITRSTTG